MTAETGVAPAALLRQLANGRKDKPDRFCEVIVLIRDEVRTIGWGTADRHENRQNLAPAAPTSSWWMRAARGVRQPAWRCTKCSETVLT